MTYQLAATAAIYTTPPFPNTIATAQSDPTYCGANTFSFSPSKTWLTVSGNTISVFTSTVTDVGNYKITVSVSLASYDTVTSIS